jgi:hypothetical protein
MTQTTLPFPVSRRRGCTHYWPPLIGIVFAVNVSLHLPAGAGVAPVLAASAVVYVGAAACGRRAAAWPVFGVTVALITIAHLFDTAVGSTGVLLILGIVLAGVGFLRAATRKEMLLQALGLVGFGAMALLAAGATPLLGAYVAALGVLSHAVWDEYHHHADRVVARSFARFCAVGESRSGRSGVFDGDSRNTHANPRRSRPGGGRAAVEPTV